MKRRTFVATLALVSSALSLSTHAQRAGKMWRIGVMGNSATPGNMLGFLSALETLLAREGGAPPAGTGVAAANAVYEAAGRQAETSKSSTAVSGSGS